MDDETVAMSIRVPVSLKRVFERVCRENDLTSSQVIRFLMRDFVDRNPIQGDLMRALAKSRG